MDAFAVSIVCGSLYKRLHVRHALRISFSFGAFQAFMPLIGAMASLGAKKYVADYDHWVAFILLIGVGGKMLYESFKIAPASRNIGADSILALLGLSIATSIDALVVGLTLAFIVESILLAAAIIGAVTFALSYIGVVIGVHLRHFAEGKIEAIGGLILIGLGVKILLEHVF